MADSKRKRGGKGNATGAKKDDSARFAADDARWGRGGKGEGRGGKVRLDSRFADLFTNPDFAETFELDPLGRPVKAEESTAQRLRRVYELDPDVLEKANEAQQQQQRQEGEAEVEVEEHATTEADAEVVHDEEEEPKLPKKKVAAKKAAAAAKTATQKKTKKKKAAAAAEPEAAEKEEEEEEEGEETRRLAVCKCDWDKVRAVDILVLLQSFVPATGAILGVTVYPSRLGQQRLDEEAKHGPQSIFRQKGSSSHHHHYNNNRRPRGAQSGDIDEEKLRQYELEKLDYYYAVVECDSPATAGEIYKACDGLEFERSSNVLDLSFIPDDVTFDLPPRESAREIPSNYEAPTYYTSALQHSKVELTWDADDTHRRRVMQKAKLSAEELKMSDFKAYLASDSDESDLDDDEDEGEPQFVFELETPAGVEETAAAAQKKKSKKKSDEKIDPKRRDKYRALLGALDQDEEEQQDMEITFVPGLSEKVQGLLDAKDNPDALKRKRKREPAPKTLESDEDSDFFEGAGEFDGDRHSEDEEAERRKRGGNKKKARGGKKTEEERRQEAELALLTLDEDIHRAAHKRTADDATGGKPKGRSARRAKAREEAKAAADLDLKDPRFRELVTSPEFAIDPTRIKKNSETVNKILVERSRVRAEAGGAASSEAKTVAGGNSKGPFSDSSLSDLVSSVKVKGLGPAKGRKGRAATTTTTVTATATKRSK